MSIPCLCQAARQVTLAWDPNKESTLLGYRVFFRQDSDVYHYTQPAWDGKTTGCTLTGLDEYTRYAFVVRAYDIYGNESADSIEVYLGVDPTPPPADPTPPPADPTPPPADPTPPPADPTLPPADPTLPPADPTQSPIVPGGDSITEYNCSPNLIFPGDGEITLSLSPILKLSGCSLFVFIDEHHQTQWQIVRESDSICVFDAVSSTELRQLDVSPNLLYGETTYLWRARFLYLSGSHSKWSAYRRFTTPFALESNELGQPIGISPVDGAIDQFLTPVLQCEDFKNADIEGEHDRTQWQVIRDWDNKCVYDATNPIHANAIDVPPLVLEENTLYRWVARYYRASGTLSDWSSPSRFTTGLSGQDDDGNGIPDDQEVGMSIDIDGNNVADAVQADLCCVTVLEGGGQMAVSAPDGSGVVRISAIESTDLATIGSEAQLPFDLPLGLVSFRLELDQVGGIARVRVHFSEPAPQAAKWIKYDITNGWQDYSAHAVFAHDRLSVEIELQDGGFGDADGVENGIVIDPSGYGVAIGVNTDAGSVGTPVSASSGGGGGCFTSILWN